MFSRTTISLKVCMAKVRLCSNFAKVFKEPIIATEQFTFPSTQPDLKYLLSPHNRVTVLENLIKRLEIQHEEAEKQLNDLVALAQESGKCPTHENISSLIKKYENFPNLTHPEVLKISEPKTLIPAKKWTPKTTNVRSFEAIARILAGARWENTSQVSTDRSYYLIGQLAELEQALIRYAVNVLVNEHGFKLVSVPDLLHPEVLKRCGMDVDGEITQVYQLDRSLHQPTALSGTAEMAIGGLLLNKTYSFGGNSAESVEKLVAVSRCYRAESSRVQAEKGIYRVHHFTKVEMFAITPPNIEVSDEVHRSFLEIQKKLFGDLDLSFRVLDMPPNDLGSPAYRKYDIEALLPGRRPNANDGDFDGSCFGEISSTSNCTDYQSRRLNIKTADGEFVHTVNGTACAVPRMIMAICEQFQLEQGVVALPQKLHMWMHPERESNSLGVIEPKPRKMRPTLKFIRGPKYFEAKFKEERAQRQSKKELE